jgi:hypothetical protein
MRNKTAASSFTYKQRNKGIPTKTFPAQNVPYHAAICACHKKEENRTVPLKDEKIMFIQN